MCKFHATQSTRVSLVAGNCWQVELEGMEICDGFEVASRSGIIHIRDQFRGSAKAPLFGRNSWCQKLDAALKANS